MVASPSVMWVIPRRCLTVGVFALCGCGIEVRDIRVDANGLGDVAPIDGITALEDSPSELVAVPEVSDGGPAKDLGAPPEASTDLGPGCPSPQSPCGSICALLSSDPSHCGSCGNRCVSDESCTFGTCLARGSPSTRAGVLCTRPNPMGGADMACGTTLVCLSTRSTPVCSVGCIDNASQALERAMCGGVGSTCLRMGDGAMGDALCLQACAPGAARGSMGSCRAGFVCTGWWFTHMDGRADTPGCVGFCGQNSDCPMGSMCNVRLGRCGLRVHDGSRRPDGSACDPTMIDLVMEEGVRRNTQCRGECVGVSPSDRRQGICGSYIDLSASPACPDDPLAVLPETDPGSDNLGLCLLRSCRANRDCAPPLVCRFDEDPSGRPDRMGPTFCDYSTMTQPSGIP